MCRRGGERLIQLTDAVVLEYLSSVLSGAEGENYKQILSCFQSIFYRSMSKTILKQLRCDLGLSKWINVNVVGSQRSYCGRRDIQIWKRGRQKVTLWRWIRIGDITVNSCNIYLHEFVHTCIMCSYILNICMYMYMHIYVYVCIC